MIGHVLRMEEGLRRTRTVVVGLGKRGIEVVENDGYED